MSDEIPAFIKLLEQFSAEVCKKHTWIPDGSGSWQCKHCGYVIPLKDNKQKKLTRTVR